MELEDASTDVNKVGNSVKSPKGEKLCLTKVEDATEQFLREVFTPMENEDHKDLCSKLIVGHSLHHPSPPRQVNDYRMLKEH